MVSARHTVLVEAVPRSWALAALALLDDLARDSRAEAGRVLLPDGTAVPDVRLVTGRHLRPGAVYVASASASDAASDADASARVTIRQWDRRGGVRLGLDAGGSDGTLRMEGVLRGLDRPRLVEVTGEAAGSGRWPSLRRVRGRARLRPEDWWTAFDHERAPRAAPARVRLDHRLGRAEARAEPVRRADDGRWEVRVTVSVRGRGPLRPLTAVALRLVAARIRRSVVRGLDDAARQWNEQVPPLVAADPSAPRRKRA
ncbi:hypothetical protein [Streptomyces sp. NPDC006997]|uniref:hypothetical protein n=1 Tax=Streptomyces sp. NPDC006997 TaxID=3155356 RepID=UPI0033F3D07F